MDKIRSGLYDIVERGEPMTVRQVFYRAVRAGLLDKTETEYNQTVGRILKDLRLLSLTCPHPDGCGCIPFDWIADNTRWMRKPKTWDSVEDALRKTAKFYRRQLWADQDVYVEIWLEKEALASVIYQITGEFDVPLMVTRGYPSLSFVFEAAEAIANVDKETFIYYLGDHDPSGVDIPRNVEARLREFAPDADITFERLAVTPEQIEWYGLVTRPTKKTDTRSKSFDGESVEVDAIDPDDLRQLVRDAIEFHIDPDALAVTKAAEDSEREILERIAATAGGAA